MPAREDMTIGVLAKRTRCSVPTVRYYEEIGLLPEANRRSSGHRIYGEADLRRLTFIRRCRDFGFSIDQIKELVALAGPSGQSCAAARDLVQAHLFTVQDKLNELCALEHSLKRYVEDCDARCVGGPPERCVILEDLGASNAVPCCGPGKKGRASARACNDDCGSGEA